MVFKKNLMLKLFILLKLFLLLGGCAYQYTNEYSLDTEDVKKILLLHKILSRLYIIVIVLLPTLGFLWEVKKVILVSSTLKDIK